MNKSSLPHLQLSLAASIASKQLRPRAAPNRISRAAFRQSHRGVALGWRWGMLGFEHRAKTLCLQPAMGGAVPLCACEHSFPRADKRTSRTFNTVLGCRRSSDPESVRISRCHTCSRPSFRNASGGHWTGWGDPSFAAICSQAKANRVDLVPAAAGCLSELHVCARIYQGMYSFQSP